MPYLLIVSLNGGYSTENWTTLAEVSDLFVTTTLNSPRSYTIADSQAGVSLNVVGTDFTTQPFGGWNVLASSTITKFTFTLSSALRDDPGTSFHKHHDLWTVEKGSPQHIEMLRVLKEIIKKLK